MIYFIRKGNGLLKCRKDYADDDKFKEYRNAQKKKRNEKTMASATNSGRSWKQDEIDIVIKHEVPDIEIARMLGRTLSAVSTCRRKYFMKQMINS